MKEIVRTSDRVLISRLTALLEGHDIPVIPFDNHMSSTEGMIGIFPQRLVVIDEDEERARQVIRDAGFGDSLYDGQDGGWL